jgi:hypothetical protein
MTCCRCSCSHFRYLVSSVAVCWPGSDPRFFVVSTTLTHEPELGRKLLDLHKLYNTVTKLGGYDKITERKGGSLFLARSACSD